MILETKKQGMFESIRNDGLDVWLDSEIAEYEELIS